MILNTVSFTEELQPAIQRFYEILNGNKRVSVKYKSSLQRKGLHELLADKLDKDKVYSIPLWVHRRFVFELGVAD